MTANQTRIIHIAIRQLALADAAYRTILRTVSGSTSSTELSHREFEEVMAILEAQGFRHAGKGETYWRGKFQRAAYAHTHPTEAPCTEQQARAIEGLCQEAGLVSEGFCMRMTKGRSDRAERLTADEAHKMIEGLKVITARKEDRAVLPNLEWR